MNGLEGESERETGLHDGKVALIRVSVSEYALRKNIKKYVTTRVRSF